MDLYVQVVCLQVKCRLHGVSGMDRCDIDAWQGRINLSLNFADLYASTPRKLGGTYSGEGHSWSDYLRMLLRC
jgi:hypothetical protein